MNIKHYTYRVMWGDDDQQYIGLCAEFPSLSFLADKMEDALTGIVSLVFDVVDDMLQNGEKIPTPLSEKHSSQC